MSECLIESRLAIWFVLGVQRMVHQGYPRFVRVPSVYEGDEVIRSSRVSVMQLDVWLIGDVDAVLRHHVVESDGDLTQFLPLFEMSEKPVGDRLLREEPEA